MIIPKLTKNKIMKNKYEFSEITENLYGWQEKTPFYKDLYFWVGVVLAGLFVIGLLEILK